MIIYTNDGNPLGLHLAICAKLGKKTIAIENVDLNDKRIQDIKHLPILELDSGQQLFASNSAALYLNKNDNIFQSLVQRWMEWSLTRLAVVIIQQATVRGNIKNSLLGTTLKTLNDELSKNRFLVNNSLTAADTSIWCLLSIDGVLKNLDDIDNIRKWMQTIAEHSIVKEAVQQIPLQTLSIAGLQQSNKFGGFLSHNNPDNVQLQNEYSVDSSMQNLDVISGIEIELARQHFINSKTCIDDKKKIVLPVPGKRNILVTSALPYVNNVPHLGNIIGCVLSADIFARYSRCCGYNTLYIGGTDEYGTATETKALAEGLTPRQICDKYYEIHNTIYQWYNISFDYFGRTTTPEQTKIVQEIFSQLLVKQLLDIETVDQLLCEKCQRYLADRFVQGICPHPGCGYEDARGDQCDGCSKLINAIELIQPRCNTCGTTPIVRQSKQFFLNLPKIEPKLREWLETTDSKWSHNARIITKSWLREGLKSRCITRDLKWGIPVPHKGFEDKVFYVWFDAPIGYMSITNCYTDEWKQWWLPLDKNINIELFQFMAKDNVPFHSVMFPCTLLGVGIGHTLVSNIMATEYLTYEDGKFSKSRGTGVFGNDAVDTGIPADVWRFYLASARPEGQDSNFNWNELVTRNNSELLNNLGNFINRTLVFCEKNFNSMVPAISIGTDELELLALVNRELNGYVQSMEKAKFRDGLQHILTVSRHGNQYMQFQQPWVLLKGTDDEKQRAATVIGLNVNLVCLLANLLNPFLPQTAAEIYKQLNTPARQINSYKPFTEQYIEVSHQIGKPMPLFNKIEQTTLMEMKKKFGSSQQTSNTINAAEQPKKNFSSIQEAEAAISAQGEKVRKLKTNGAEKAIWQPEVQALLDYKNQLAILQKSKTQINEQNITNEAEVKAAASKTQIQTKTVSLNDSVNPQKKNLSIADLELKITQQGDKVRELKANNKDKSVWTPEVNVLLALKKQLVELKSVTTEATTTINATPFQSGKSKKKKK